MKKTILVNGNTNHGDWKNAPCELEKRTLLTGRSSIVDWKNESCELESW